MTDKEEAERTEKQKEKRQKKPLLKSSGFHMMDPLGVEPRFQEPESCVRSITLRVPITVINYSRDSENGKGLKQKNCKNL